MLYQYEIKKNNGEEALYLYLDMKYEFSKELAYAGDLEIKHKIKNFIVSNHIPFKGSKIYLVVDGIVVKTINQAFFNQDQPVDPSFTSECLMVPLQLEDNALCEISLKEYLYSVLFSYYDSQIHDEVYKAICILFNGYVYKFIKKKKAIPCNSPYGYFQPLSYYQSIYTNYHSILNHFSKIIQCCEGLFLSYQGDYILPFLHFSNDGKTLPHPSYPYLSSVKSLWDLASPYYLKVIDYSFDEVSKTIGFPFFQESQIVIQHQNTIIIDSHPFTYSEFQKVFHLNSSIFYFIMNHDSLRIITKGLGNSYGLSIFGANEVAKNGANVFQILSYYFPKTKILKHIKETI